MITFHGALLVAGGAWGLFALYRLGFWTIQAYRVMSPGYLTPPPTRTSIVLRVLLARLVIFLFVGPFKVKGSTNTDYFGRLIAFGPHQTERDALIALWLLGARQVRYFIADNQVHGILRFLVAYTGGIVVHTDRPGAAAAALLAARRAMKQEPDTSFVIFPQGRLVRENTLRRSDYKEGIATLGFFMSKDSKLPVSYMAFAIFYDRDPAHATVFHRRLEKCGIKGFRSFFGEVVYRAFAVVGAPVPTEIMPESREQTTDALFTQTVIVAMQTQRLADEYKPSSVEGDKQ
jgi:1-acyl-sn-glycerol-3-phosphate acyltransferase